MKKISGRNTLLIIALVLGIAVVGGLNARGAEGKKQDLMGRIVAIGIPGVSAIGYVGSFLPGGRSTTTRRSPPTRSLDEYVIRRASSLGVGRTSARRWRIPTSEKAHSYL